MAAHKVVQVETTFFFIAATTLFTAGAGTNHWIQGAEGAGWEGNMGLWNFCIHHAPQASAFAVAFISTVGPGCFSIDTSCNYSNAGAGVILVLPSCSTFMAVRVLAIAAVFFSLVAALFRLGTLVIQATTLRIRTIVRVRIITLVIGAIAGVIGIAAMSVFVVFLMQNHVYNVDVPSAPFNVYSASYDYSFAMVTAAWAFQLAAVRLLFHEHTASVQLVRD